MADVAPPPAFKKRGNKASNIRKRPATPPQASDSDDSEYSTDEDSASGMRMKRRRKDGVKVAGPDRQTAKDLSKSTTYSADRSTAFAANDNATKVSRLYSEDAQDGNRESAGKADNEGAARAVDGTYKGTSTYGSFIQKNADAPVRQIGPIKAPNNIRTITTTDFAPDVCKDYKQTGFCGFGDSCKFLHAREDYAQGWQLDKEWEKAGSKSKSKSGSGDAAANGNGAKNEAGGDHGEKILENIPFACIICKQPYKMPVVTKCGHYFCEKCAMQRYMKEKKRACAACGADTGGTFQIARKLKELLERKKQRMEDRAKAAELGEDEEQIAEG